MVQPPPRNDGGKTTMSSTWPIVMGVAALIASAFWYDARNASASDVSPPHAAAAEVVR
jgi:hypothetical protein